MLSSDYRMLRKARGVSALHMVSRGFDRRFGAFGKVNVGERLAYCKSKVLTAGLVCSEKQRGKRLVPRIQGIFRKREKRGGEKI